MIGSDYVLEALNIYHTTDVSSSIKENFFILKFKLKIGEENILFSMLGHTWDFFLIINLRVFKIFMRLYLFFIIKIDAQTLRELTVWQFKKVCSMLSLNILSRSKLSRHSLNTHLSLGFAAHSLSCLLFMLWSRHFPHAFIALFWMCCRLMEEVVLAAMERRHLSLRELI